MQRRKFVIGMGALASGAAAAMGTGAFSSVEADRDFEVEVSDDSTAYLALTSASHYADGSGNSLGLDFTSSNSTPKDGEGLNKNATTMFTHVFNIENRGTDTVGVQIETPDLSGGHVHFFVGEQGGVTLSDYDKNGMANELDYDSPANDNRVLEAGDSLKVGLYFQNNGDEWDIDDESITINALDQETATHISN